MASQEQEISCAPLPTGGHDCDFVESPSDSLECPVCLLVLREPHLLSCCGVKICHSCISGIQTRNGPCPKCRKDSFVTLLEKELERSILGLKVRCSLGCKWIGELRHLEQHVSSSSEGECPLVEVTCRYGCGQVMKREEGRVHEEETCSKRPIEVQLARLQYLVNRDMEEMRNKHETEVGELKELIAKQTKEISELRQSITSSKDSSIMTTRSLNPDILEFMPRFQCSSIPGVSYYPSQSKVEICGCCQEEMEARAWLFKTEYQKMLRTFRTRNITLPANIDQCKLDDCLTELNTKYPLSYAFVLKNKGNGPDVVMIYSIGSQHQLDEIAQMLGSKFSSMTINYIQVSDKRRITLKSGDITKEDVDVIVSSTTRKLAIDGRGVASALNRASNGELKKQTEEYLSSHGPIEAGGVAITKGGGSLKCKHVFHIAGPTSQYSISESSVTNILEKSISKVLTEAENVKAKSIAIPAVGAGSYLLKNDVIASCLLRVVKEFKYSTDTCVTDIRIVIYSSAAYPAFLKAFGISA